MKSQQAKNRKIKDALPWGAQKEIAKRAGVTEKTVKSVLDGASSNRKVWAAINGYLAEQLQQQQEIINTASNLSQLQQWMAS